MAISEYPSLPEYSADHVTLLKKIINVVRGAMKGKTNNTGTCTLGAGSATTVVQLSKGDLGPDSIILFMPKTASAATEFSAGIMYVSLIESAKTKNKFTITHTNSGVTDRIFNFIIVG